MHPGTTDMPRRPAHWAPAAGPSPSRHPTRAAPRRHPCCCTRPRGLRAIYERPWTGNRTRPPRRTPSSKRRATPASAGGRGNRSPSCAGTVEVDAVAAERNSVLTQELELSFALGDRAVRTHDAEPGDARLMRRGQHAAHEARRVRVDVAVGLHVAGRDVANPVDDLRDPGIVLSPHEKTLVPRN